MHLQSTVDPKFQTSAFQADLFQVEISKMNQSFERKCKMQQQTPGIVLREPNKSATLHVKWRENQSLYLRIRKSNTCKYVQV